MMHDGFGTGLSNYGDWLCGPGAFFPGPLGWIVTLFFWALIIFLVVKLLQTLFFRGKGPLATPLDTLKERYAQGEIKEEEYQRMKMELG